MQNSKRIQRVLKSLSDIEEILNFHTNGSGEYRVRFKEIQELINELGLEKKEDHAKLAKKLKDLWDVD
jgi:hypothetical protein